MFQDEFRPLERTVRTLASSRWRKLAMMRSVANQPQLDAEIDRLYRAVEGDRLHALSEQDAAGWLSALMALESQLARVEQAIPFERKLKPFMRPFRRRFQAIIRLRNAANCGVARLRQRMGQRHADIGERVRLGSAEQVHLEELLEERAAGWNAAGMDVYDHL